MNPEGTSVVFSRSSAKCFQEVPTRGPGCTRQHVSGDTHTYSRGHLQHVSRENQQQIFVGRGEYLGSNFREHQERASGYFYRFPECVGTNVRDRLQSRCFKS